MDEYGMDYDQDDELPKRNPVYCAAIDGVLDMDEDDLGYPHIPDLWQRLLADKRRVPERGLWCPTCIKARPSQPEWMIVYERGGQKIAAHHNPNHKAHNSSNESDEHKEFKARIARAAQLGGHPVDIEDRSPDGSRRTDVLVTGHDGAKFGFEPQLSYRPGASIQKRDRIARSHGITPVWTVTDPKAPLIDLVRWARTDNLPARAIRDSRDLLIRGGLRGLELEKCDHRNPLPCPVKKVGRCGLWHPKWKPIGQLLDDFVRDVAAGELVSVAERFDGRLQRFWTLTAHRAQYVDNGGVLVGNELSPDALEIHRQAGSPAVSRDVECTKDRTGEFVPTRKPPRDGGGVIRPAVTISQPLAVPGKPRRYSDLAMGEIATLAKEFGCGLMEVGPCGRCYGPTIRYGDHARILCTTCRPPK